LIRVVVGQRRSDVGRFRFSRFEIRDCLTPSGTKRRVELRADLWLSESARYVASERTLLEGDDEIDPS